MASDIESAVLFGVPLYRKRLARFVEHQQPIIDYVMARRGAESGVHKSNYRGWHSPEDLHLSDDEHVAWLLARVKDAASACIHGFEGNRAHGNIQLVAAWANVNQDGAWNMPHMHLPTQWSGAFYVSLGDTHGATPGEHDGAIVFFDPLPLGELFKRPPTITVEPKVGMMLLFPAYLNHMVTPYYGQSPRISIAFNLAVEYP